MSKISTTTTTSCSTKGDEATVTTEETVNTTHSNGMVEKKVTVTTKTYNVQDHADILPDILKKTLNIDSDSDNKSSNTSSKKTSKSSSKKTKSSKKKVQESSEEESSSEEEEESEDEFKNVDSFNKEGVIVHNQYRKLHGCTPLKHNPEAQRVAQEWANYLVSRGSMQHRSPNKFGENLYWYSGGDSSAKDACDAWYSEIKDFSFGYEPRNFSAVGHFTQMVWKTTTSVGMAKASGRSGTFIVANYAPAGNMMGTFAQNVPRRV